MGTVDNPDVYIQYYDAGWNDITQYAKNFTIKDAGILKIPQADVLFSNLPTVPSLHDRFRILVNTNELENPPDGINYMPFYGRIAPITLSPKLGTISKKFHRLVAYGLEKRLKNDTITWKYASEQEAHGALWTFKSMIEDFLVLPDSGYDTGMTLDTDTGNILNDVYGAMDFTRQSLQDALRVIAETIGYDGYIWIEGADTAKLKYVALGSLAANPATTIQDPFVRKPELENDPDEIRNYILVWGGVDKGYPVDGDKFTERAMAKYPSPNEVWEPLDGETIVDSASDPADLKNTNDVDSATANTLTDNSKSWTTDQWKNYSVFIKDGKGAGQIRRVTTNTATQLTVAKNWTETPDNTSKYQIFIGDNPTSTEKVSGNQLSRYAMKVTKEFSGLLWSYRTRFRIDRTGVASIDLQDRYHNIIFSLWVQASAGEPTRRNIGIRLTDINNNRVKLASPYSNSHWSFHSSQTPKFRTEYGDAVSMPTLPPGTEIDKSGEVNHWVYDVGSSFDATQVKYLDILAAAGSYPVALWIDRLYFAGSLKINPFENPQYYPNYATQNGDPANRDLTSINNYGVRIYHHDDRDINSFERADYEGDRILAVLKDPIKTVKFTKKGLEWLRPNQTVGLYSTSLGIGSVETPETWRTVQLQWNWRANHPVYCTGMLVPQYAKVPPVFAPSGEMASPSLLPSLPDWWRYVT